MAIISSNKIQFWLVRVRNGKVAAFGRWWISELRQLLPATWQERLQHAWRRVVVMPGPQQLQLGVQENQVIEWLESFSLEHDAALQRQQILSLLDKDRLLEVPRFLLLDQSKVLRKKLMLPAAAGSNLQQVLAFEMDRQTPFRADDVYYAWQTSVADTESGQIGVDLFVIPRKALDGSLGLLEARGLAASGVDVIDGDRSLGINLLPPEKRFKVVNPQLRLNLSLGFAVLVLLVIVMTQSLSLRASRVSALEAAIEQVQDEAKRVQRLREQVEETSEAASFLTRRRAESPMAIELLADITRTLPDDTYLDRLVISQDGVIMQGKSRNAQQLIEVVNKSEALENAAFRGSTRLDAASGLEIFEVNAQVSSRGAP